MSRISVEELDSYLWGSAVLLRTNIDAGAYKQYIFPLLFFKRICDVYNEETQAAIAEYGEDVVDFDEDDFRKKCKEFALKQVELQKIKLSSVRAAAIICDSYF